MAHGTPDWGLVGPKTTTFGLDDLGEHAVRLGSPHLFDRRGDVLLLEDFRNGLGPFVGGGTGVGWYVTLSTGHTRQGAYSAKLVTGTAALSVADLIVDMAYPHMSKFGLEYTFSLDADTAHIEGRISWDDGVTTWTGMIEYSFVNQTLRCWDQNLGMDIFAVGLGLAATAQPSHTLKFVVDGSVTPAMYSYCILNEVPYLFTAAGVGAREIDRTGPVVRPRLRFHIRHLDNAGVHVPVWIDNVICTQNEP